MAPLVVQGLTQQVVWLVLGVGLIGILARRFNIPYEVGLVVVGLGVGQSQAIPHLTLDPAVLLFVFLPPLLFDAAFRLDMGLVDELAGGILFLAVPGVLLTTFAVGEVVSFALHLPLVVGLVFGSIVAATDPVAVVGVLRRLQMPSRLVTLLEAESLVNDGTAITLYTALIGLGLAGSVQPLGLLALFGKEVLGGALIGGIAGLLFSRLTAATDDHLIEMTLSTALAWGSYLVAEALGTSGALACVAAGLVHGSYGRESGMSEATRRVLDDLWEYLGFLASALVFLLFGMTVSIRLLLTQAWPMGVAIVAVVLLRALMVSSGMAILPKRLLDLSRGEGVVLSWGGLLGPLTASLALALPVSTPGRDTVIAMALGVVLFTLGVQGLSLPLVVRRLGLQGSAQRGHKEPL